MHLERWSKLFNGQIDVKALARESMTREELIEVIHRQGFEGLDKVRSCHLEPNGTFYVEAFEPSADEKRHEELLALNGIYTRLCANSFMDTGAGAIAEVVG